jgi:phospholipase D1/2
LTEHSIQTAYKQIISSAQHYVYIENQFFITATGDQQKPIKNTIGRAIVDAVVRAAKEGRKFRVIVLLPAVPGFAGDLREDAAIGTRAIMDYQYKSICRGEHSILQQIAKEGVDPAKYIFFFNLRSYDRLNRTPEVAAKEKETGVKYKDVQRAAEENVMPEAIHNTSNGQAGKEAAHIAVLNGLRRPTNETQPTGIGVDHNGGHLGAPSLGNTAADSTKSSSSSSPPPHDPTYSSVSHHALSHQPRLSTIPWNNHRSSSSSSSPTTTATTDGSAPDPDTAPSSPISLSPLDPDDPLQSEIHSWIQEELYIHSKVLIVDDRVMVIGSSNLNDRSQLGNRDSEISVVIEDEDKVASLMDGKEYQAGRVVKDLRTKLWREHLGLIKPQTLDAEGLEEAMPPGWKGGDGKEGGDTGGKGKGVENGEEEDEDAKLVQDPLSDELWKMWTERATQNTLVFRQLFHADPDDHGKFICSLQSSTINIPWASVSED